MRGRFAGLVGRAVESHDAVAPKEQSLHHVGPHSPQSNESYFHFFAFFP